MQPQIQQPSQPQQTTVTLTEANVNTLFSLRLPPELAFYVKTNFDNFSALVRALIQSYKDNRIDREKVYYEER